MKRFLTFLRHLLWQPEWIPLALVFILGLIMGITLDDADGQEIADFETHTPECESCFSYFEPLPRVWPSDIEVVLNTANMPWWANEGKIAVALTTVFKKINTYAEVPFVYAGTTQADLINSYSESRRHTVLVAFDALTSLGYGHIWWNWHGEQEINYGEVSINDQITESQFPGVLLHEFACHILYMDHSDVQESICAGPPHTSYNSAVYQATLRLDDIKAIQSLYAPRPNRQGAITSFDGETVCFYQPEIEYESITAQEIGSCSNINDVSAVILE